MGTNDDCISALPIVLYPARFVQKDVFASDTLSPLPPFFQSVEQCETTTDGEKPSNQKSHGLPLSLSTTFV
jgi:hypothetical protein